MRGRTAARWTLAPVLVVVYAVLGWLYIAPGGSVSTGYAVTIVADAEYALRVLAPLSAGVCAFLSRPVGRYLDARSSVRSWARGLLTLTWPALGAAAVAYLIVIVALGVSAGGLGELVNMRALSMIVTGESVLLAWGAVGLLAGSVAHPLVAPLLAVAVHLVLTWSAALATPWPRLLTGIQYGCCTSAQQPRLDSLGFALGAAGVLLAVCLLAATMGGMRRRRNAVALGLVVGSSLLVLAARTLPVGEEHVLAEPRPDETVCQAGEPEVCLWPESADDLPAVSSWLVSAWDAWTQRGVDLDRPAIISDYSADPDTPGLGYQVGAGQAQTVANAAYTGLVTRGGGGMCAFEAEGVQAASVWLARVAGIDTSDMQMPPSVRDEVATVTGLGVRDQDAWLEDVLAGLDRCRG